MAFTPQRDFDVGWAFSTKKQTNYATLLADVDLDKRTYFNAIEFGNISSKKETDGQKFGKGHEFSTTVREVARDLRLARGFDLSSLMAGWAGFFGMGKIATSGAGPFTHVHTFADPAVSVDVPVTTIYEEVAAGEKRKLHSMAINDFTISGRNQETVQMQMNLIGSGQVTDGAVTLPSLTALTFFLGGDVTIKLGPQGATVDIGECVLDWSFTVSQNLKADLGYSPGSGVYRDKMWYGKRTARASLRVFWDNTADMMDLFLGNTLRELEFVLNTSGTDQVNALFPAIRFTEYDIGVEDGFLINNLSSGDDGVFKDAGGTPNEAFQMTTINGQAVYG